MSIKLEIISPEKVVLSQTVDMAVLPALEGDIAAMEGHAKITLLEGYLFDGELAQKAFYQAADISHKAGRKIALSLSDPFCVKRHLVQFKDFVSNHVDMVFANQFEICALYETEDLEKAIQNASQDIPIAVITCGEKGSVILANSERIEVAVFQRLLWIRQGQVMLMLLDFWLAGLLTGLMPNVVAWEVLWLRKLFPMWVPDHYRN